MYIHSTIFSIFSPIFRNIVQHSPGNEIIFLPVNSLWSLFYGTYSSLTYQLHTVFRSVRIILHHRGRHTIVVFFLLFFVNYFLFII